MTSDIRRSQPRYIFSPLLKKRYIGVIVVLRADLSCHAILRGANGLGPHAVVSFVGNHIPVFSSTRGGGG